MKMNRTLAGGLVAALAGSALIVLGVAAPASAHTPTASATCEALTIDATNYQLKPGYGDPQIEVENPDYVPAVPGTPAIGEPIIRVEKPNPDYKPATPDQTVEDGFMKWNWTGGPVASTPPAPPSPGWHQVGRSSDTKGSQHGVVHQGEGKGSYFYYERLTKVIPGTPAQGDPTIWVGVPNPDFVPAVPEIPAQGTPTILIDNPDYVAGDETPNTVEATINGEEVLSEEFGTSFSRVIPFADKTVANEWSVTITAWNDPTGSKGWTKTISGTTEPCDEPEVPVDYEKLSGTVVVDCKAETVTFSGTNDGETTVVLSTGFDHDADGQPDFGDGFELEPGESDSLVYTFDMLDNWSTLKGYLFVWDGEEIAHVVATSDDFAPVKCEDPVVNPANPTAAVTATCDGTDVILTNPFIGGPDQITASFVVNVDGEFYGAYAVPAGGREEIAIEGSHKVEVYQAGTSEWKLIASAEAKTDCEVPPTEPEPEEPTTPTKPVPEKPSAPVKAAAKSAPTDDTLAQTGVDPLVLALGAPAAVALMALGGLLIAKRRRDLAEVTDTQE